MYIHLMTAFRLVLIHLMTNQEDVYSHLMNEKLGRYIFI